MVTPFLDMGYEDQKKSANDMTVHADQSVKSGIHALLSWYCESGVDEATADSPLDRFELSAQRKAAINTSAAQSDKRPAGKTPPRAPSAHATYKASPVQAQAQESARAVAFAAQSLEDLEKALLAYEACGLKHSAMSTVFADGPTDAPVMVIGGAPDADTDRSGIAYSGDAGLLLDRMLAAISLSRKDTARLSYLIPWRPPGNRQPTDEELAHCLPFLQRHIELLKPALVISLGVSASNALMARDHTITKARGRFVDLTLAGHNCPLVTLHRPGDLLNQPRLKAFAWKDCLAIADRLAALKTG